MTNKQYHIQLDSSGRDTLCNHQFLQKILPVVDTPDYLPKQPPPERSIDSEPLGDTPELMDLDVMDEDKMMVDHHTIDMKVDHPPTSESDSMAQHKDNTATKTAIPTNARTNS